MKRRKILRLFLTHCIVGILGFAVGIYTLPILLAPTAPATSQVKARSAQAAYTGQFKKDLKDSDFLHWGDGTVFINARSVSFIGKLSPGPDYKLYLSPKFVETESAFKQTKNQMVVVGDIKTFNNFIVNVPSSINPANYNSVIVWCESFEQFITAAKYR